MCIYKYIYLLNEYLKLFCFQNNVSNLAKNNTQVQEMKPEKLIIHSAPD